MEQRAQLLALLSAPGYQQFADLDGMNRPCGRVIVMRRQLLNQHEGAPQILQAVHAMPAAKWLRVKVGTAAGEASLLTDPDSTKNNTLVRDAESQQTKEGNQRYLGMNRHIALKADSGPVHAAVGIAVHVNGVTHEHALVSSKKDNALASAGCKGGDKREGTLGGRAGGPVGRRLVLGRLLDGADPKDAISAQMRRVKASFPANVRHPLTRSRANSATPGCVTVDSQREPRGSAHCSRCPTRGAQADSGLRRAGSAPPTGALRPATRWPPLTEIIL